jgi:hypothetical protein
MFTVLHFQKDFSIRCLTHLRQQLHDASTASATLDSWLPPAADWQLRLLPLDISQQAGNRAKLHLMKK